MNMEYIGYLIKDIRESKKIGQEILCKGLCSRYMLGRIEQGKCVPGKLLLDALFQRLGVSRHKFETSYTQNEYAYIKLRQQLINAVLKEKLNTLDQELLKCKEYMLDNSSKILVKQFTLLIEILMEFRKDKIDEKIENKIYFALSLTCPEFDYSSILEYLFHDEELNLIVLLAEYFYKQKEIEKAFGIYYSLLQYLDNNVFDKEEQGRICPKVVLLLGGKLYQQRRYEELYICKKGVELLKGNYRIHLLSNLLGLCLLGWEKENNMKKYNENKELYLEGIQALREIGGSRVNQMELLLLSSDPVAPGYILGEQIRSLRNVLGITQEDLGDVCDPATISRIEGGRMPHNTNYSDIMQRMGREGIRYYPFIKSNQYKLHIARANWSRYTNLQDYDNAFKELALLEEGLDRTEPVNKQFLIKSRAILEEEVGIISQDKLHEKLIEALRITAPIRVEPWEKEDDLRMKLTEDDLIMLLRNWPLTQNEILIWSNIGIAEGERGNRGKKIQILQTIKENYEKSGVNILHNVQGYLLVIYNLANALQTKKVTKEALGIIERGIEISLNIGIGNYLVGFLNIKGWCLEAMREEKEACLKLFKQAFSIAHILDYKIMQNHIEQHCKNKFQVDIKTYSYDDINKLIPNNLICGLSSLSFDD